MNYPGNTMKPLIETRQILHVGIEIEEAKNLIGDWEVLLGLIDAVMKGDGSNTTDYAALEAKAVNMNKYFLKMQTIIKGPNQPFDKEPEKQ